MQDRAGGGAHVPALDGLRGVAILLVILNHLAPDARPLPDGLGVLELARGAASAGWVGVDLFFVLSGFLITGILCDAKGSSSYFRHFWARRALRIFPAYYLFLAGTLLWLRWNTPTAEAAHLPYWIYLQNYGMAPDGDAVHFQWAHTWSLAVEEQFYLVWPVVVWLASRTALLRVCLTLVVLAPALRTGLTLAGVDPFAIYIATPARMDALALGALVAVLARGKGGLARFVPAARAAGTVAVLGVVSIAAWRGNFGAKSFPVQTAGFTCVAVGFAALLVLVVEARPRALTRALEAGWLRLFGRTSYAVYLIHPFAIAVLWQWMVPEKALRLAPTPGAVGQYLVYCAAAIALSLACGVASWHLYEKHWLRLKDRFPMGAHDPPPRQRIDGLAESCSRN